MTKTRHRPASTAEKLSCLHRGCAGERFIIPLSAIIGLNRRLPMPGLDPVLAELRQVIPLHHDVSFCLDCGCLLPVGTPHRH